MYYIVAGRNEETESKNETKRERHSLGELCLFLMLKIKIDVKKDNSGETSTVKLVEQLEKKYHVCVDKEFQCCWA
jgi:hypothetical protein